MSRKGENIRKRKDGRWEARYVKPDNNGGTTLGYVYADSYAKVKNKRQEFLNEINNQKIKFNSDDKFNKIINGFLKQAEYSVKPSTYEHYAMMIDAHIRPYFGEKQCALFKASDIEAFTVDMLKNGRCDGRGGLAPKSVKDLLSILRRILKYAVDKELLPYSVLNFTTPKTYIETVIIFDTEETEKLKAYAIKNQEPCNLGILVCIYTGLRLGEMCALQWKDIDFENKTITVNKTMIRLKDGDTGHTRVCIEKPKTHYSNRVIPVPEALLVHLETRRVENAETYVITGVKKYSEPRTYYEKYKKILAECGIEPHSFHCLRHTFATNCVRQGFDPKTLSEILGHSDVKVTFDRYIHPSMEMKRKYMDMLR